MTIDLGTQKILARIEEGIGWLTFNQPEKRNAISLKVWEAVAAAAERFGTDPQVRMVVISGAGGKAFASGADISEFDEKRDSPEARYSAVSSATRKQLEAREAADRDDPGLLRRRRHGNRNGRRHPGQCGRRALRHPSREARRGLCLP